MSTRTQTSDRHTRPASEPAGEPASPRAGSMPWPSLLTLGATTFVVLTGEMLPTAVLPHMAADLGVSEARIGLLVSIWAATIVAASFPLVALTARWNRRDVVVGALVVFAGAGVLTAAADSFAVALVGRLLGAGVTGLLWSTVNAHTAAIVAERTLARAIAVVIGGATLGTVLGVPAAGLAAEALDWRAAMLAVAVAALVVAVAVQLVVVRGPDTAAAPTTQAAVGVPRPDPALRAVLSVAGLAGIVLVGHYAAFTFITRLFADSAERLPGGMTGLLLVYGVTSAVAVLVVGYLGDAHAALALEVASGLVALALLATTLATIAATTLGGHPAVGVGIVAVWGLASGALPPLVQTLIMQRGGPRLRRTAGTVVPVTFNLAIAAGAAAGSGVVGAWGVEALPAPAAAVVGIGVLGLLSLRRPHRVRR